jgi:putative tricarboxylic transport membrane protein
LFEGIVPGITQVLSPEMMALVALGTFISIIFGVIPGLSSVTAIALLFPFIFGMEQMQGIFFMTGLLGTATIGGSVTAILLNIPGTAVNTATMFDGHPMAKNGEAGRAIGIAATASVVGMMFGLLVLILLLPLVLKIIFLFQPPEFFMLILLGLVTVAFAAKGNMIKGLISAGFGVLIALIGASPIFGVERFTFGSQNYIKYDSIPLIAFFVGLFAVREVISYATKGGTVAKQGERIHAGFSGIMQGAKDVFVHWRITLQSSVLGTIIGLLPGVGGTVANFLGYTLGMQTSKDPSRWGTGIPEGVVASESANNAKDGGALMPTLAFGIPGSVEMALLLVAFTIVGLVPGPFFVTERPDILWALIFGYTMSAVMAAGIVFLSADLLARVTIVPVKYLLPVVLVFALVGVYASRQSIWDVALALIVGLFGYALDRLGFSLVTMAIGFVLGFLAERNFAQSLQMSAGDYSIFFTRPISATLFVVAIIILLLPIIRAQMSKHSPAATD